MNTGCSNNTQVSENDIYGMWDGAYKLSEQITENDLFMKLTITGTICYLTSTV